VVAVSPDGGVVLFNSLASNLVVGDTSHVQDVFLRNRTAGRTYRVSVGRGGRQANARSWGAAVSANGRFVLFSSNATNLNRVPDKNNQDDVFVRDRAQGATYRVSVRPQGGQFTDYVSAAGISDDGRYVAFGDTYKLLTFVRDRKRHTTREIPGPVQGEGSLPVGMSANGQFVLVEALSLNGSTDGLYLRDRLTGKYTYINGSNGGGLLDDGHSVGPGSGVFMTPDAHYVVFTVRDQLDTMWNVVRWNRVTRVVAPVLENDPGYYNVAAGASTDGRYITFSSDDPGLVAGDTNNQSDVLRRDMTTNALIRVGLGSTGAQIPQGARAGLLTADGASVIFDTPGQAVASDTNGVSDVFLRGPLP
jgi:hypothetical protein